MSDVAIIAVLEEKIDGLISYIERLEEEKQDLFNQIREKDTQISDLEGKIEAFENERAEVGKRVEHILEKLGRISDGQRSGEQVNDLHNEEVDSSKDGFQFTDSD